jgi:hypothetical protein
MAIDINIPSQVKNYANLAAFPATGALKTIYIANDTNKTYRWTGSVYVEISGTDTSSLVPTTRTLTINGTTQDLSADRTFTISTGITIGTTAITSGTVGRVLFEGTGNVVQESANFTYDNTNGIFNITGIINSVIQHTALTNYTGFGGFQLNVSGGSERAFLKLNPQTGEVKIGATGSGYFTTLYAQGLEAMRIFASTRNVGINTTTDAGFKLDVNGTARVQSTFTVQGNINADSYIKYGTACWVRGFSNTFQISDAGVNPKIALHTASGTSYFNTGGNFVFGATSANASAIVQADSTTQGFLPPRMTTTQKNAIASPATGLMVYDTTLNLIALYNGTTWITL